MRFFDPANRTRTLRTARLYAVYELIYTTVDFAAALQFVIGSILFFNDDTVVLGTWLFLVGSACFALRPTVHLAREIHYWRIGDLEKLAESAED